VSDVKSLSSKLVKKVQDSEITGKITSKVKDFAESSKELALNGYEYSK